MKKEILLDNLNDFKEYYPIVYSTDKLEKLFRPIPDGIKSEMIKELLWDIRFAFELEETYADITYLYTWMKENGFKEDFVELFFHTIYEDEATKIVQLY